MATVWVDVIIGSIVHGDLWDLNGGAIAKHINARVSTSSAHPTDQAKGQKQSSAVEMLQRLA
jgi:hypothetical protein